MLGHDQFLSNISSSNQHQHHHHHHQQPSPNEHDRPLQQSSPSDNSMSTATPPHQVSRASPASTALVMSSNNIASVQPSSRQLTPSNGSSSNGNGTGNSSSSGGRSNGPGNGDCDTGGAGSGPEGNACPPNPMIRQFACHTKSMSAGVVVSVPGISNHLATPKGINQNNVINTTIAAAQQQHQRQTSGGSGNAARHHHNNTLHHASGTISNSSQIGDKQQVIREHRVHHHRSTSHQNQQQQQHGHHHHHHHHQNHHHHHQTRPGQLNSQQQHQSQHQQLSDHHLNQQDDGSHQFLAHHHNLGNGVDSSQNFIDTQTGSSIVLNSANINNIHNRSASTQLSNLLLNQGHQPHHLATNQRANTNTLTVANGLNLGTDVNGNYPPTHVTNSIWSINNLSKSQGKLVAGDYLPHLHPYPFDPSITDISCDNVSTASRLQAASDVGGPTPGYYLHQALANGGSIAGHHHSAAAAAANGLHRTGLAGHQGGAAAGGGGGGGSGGGGGLNAHSLSASGSLRKRPEFLPICDLMFNLISMIVYFCENVFGVIALIALYYHASSKYWALVGATFMFGSNFICQYLSLRWLYKMKLDECRRKREAQEELEDEEECERRYRMSANMRNYQCGSCTWLPDGATEVQLKFLLSIALDAIMHIFCLGFLVRYIKLVIPVSDMTQAKREARDLCMLRMIHGFIQSAPLLLLQSYMVCSQSYASSIVNLSITSVILSLVNVCWALASFTKYARKKFMHKFVLTWLGILSQLLWRLGTISSRVAALIIYAVHYNYWMLVVLSLHWVAMFMWLVKPGNLLRDEVNMSRSKKLSLAVGVAWIYCFCYMSFEEHNSKAKMGVFYLIMFLENNLLFTVCQTLSAQVTWFKTLSILVVYLGFVFGMLFMMLYYKYFHVTVLNNGLSCSQDSIDSIADQLTSAGKKVAGFKPGTLQLRSEDSLNSSRKYLGNMGATLRTGSHPEIARGGNKPSYLTSGHQHQQPSHHNNHNQVVAPQLGVFSCKPINPGIKKQKLPSSHVRRQNP